MEMETRRREIARKRRRRQRQLRRRLAGSAAIGVVGLAAFLCVWGLRGDDGVEAVTGESGVDGVERVESEVGIDGVELVGKSDALNSGLGDLTLLPEKFDLREHSRAVAVPDQGTFGTCWAFASLKALETSAPSPPLSADHMSMQNSFGLGQDDGGDYSMSSAYLLAWQGPVLEEVDPYGDGRSTEDAEPVYHVQEIQILGEKDFEAIKRAVYGNGGVQSSFYMPQTAGTERSRYYSEKTHSFYYNGSSEPNHDIVIIGWDDTYPKENFVQQPEQDGAFLCMNTWGEGFGDGGFFYISYEDSRIGGSCVAYTKIESTENYDRIWQTDLCGWTGQMGYGTSKAWFANVYEADEALDLAAAGFYATAAGTEYRVYVAGATDGYEPTGEAAVGVSGMDAGISVYLAQRTLAAEGCVDNVGYYTIPLGSTLTMTGETVDEGQQFAVIVEIDSPGTTEPVAIEYRAGSRTSKVDIGDGEGYISSDGVNWERTETAHQCNVCLKVYTNTVE